MTHNPPPHLDPAAIIGAVATGLVISTAIQASDSSRPGDETEPSGKVEAPLVVPAQPTPLSPLNDSRLI